MRHLSPSSALHPEAVAVSGETEHPDSAMSALIRGGYIESRKRTPGSPQAYRLIWSRAVA
jgi:hypothetical protein